MGITDKMEKVPTRVRLAVTVTVVAGLVLLVSSSLFLDNWHRQLSVCEKMLSTTHVDCDKESWFVTAAALGLIAAVVQLMSAGLVFQRRFIFWQFAQGVLIVLTSVALGMALHRGALSIQTVTTPAVPGVTNEVTVRRYRALLFVSSLVVHFICSLVSVLFTLFGRMERPRL